MRAIRLLQVRPTRSLLGLIAIALLMTSTSLIPGQEASTKIVIALQAFPPEERGREVRDICLAAGQACGVRSAFGHGAEPHVTLGAWRVTPDEFASAQKEFASARWNSLRPPSVASELVERRFGESTGWFLCPAPESLATASAFRAKALAILAWNFEEFEGRNREDWWPHLTLFTAGQGPRDRLLPFLDRLRGVGPLRWSRVALVKFDQGIHTVAVAAVNPADP